MADIDIRQNLQSCVEHWQRVCSASSLAYQLSRCALGQALERSVEAGGSLDAYEVEGPDRAELLQDLAEFQLATVRRKPLDASVVIVSAPSVALVIPSVLSSTSNHGSADTQL